MKWRIEPSTVTGSLEMPGDKSIAHRALMLAALAGGTSEIGNVPAGEDVLATARCMRALGASLVSHGPAVTVVSSGALRPPMEPLDAANSGTTMRLLSGILAGQPFASRLLGDESLSRRPMDRVIEPLTSMGARIRSNDGRAPLDIFPSVLHGIRYTLPVASAQVKSALLLAGLFAVGHTSVVEPVPTRDHTERMLRALGVEIHTENGVASLRGEQQVSPFSMEIPGDPSSAAFFLAGGALTGGEVEARGLCVNPTRTGFLAVLRRMGAGVEVRNERAVLGEPVGDVVVRGPVRFPVVVEAREVPILVDEIPLIALLATQAEGTSVIRGASELRVKETDRIAAVAGSLQALGASVEEQADGFIIHGPTALRGTSVSSGGDHRLAMMLAVAGLAAAGTTEVEAAEAASVSYPGFDRTIAGVGGNVRAA